MVPEPSGERALQPVERIRVRFEKDIVFRDADLYLWPRRLHRGISRAMRGGDRRDDADVLERAFEKRRPDTLPVALARVHHRLVVREPEARLISQPLDDEPAVACKNFRCILVQESAPLREPERKREMPEIRHRREAAGLERSENGAEVI